MSNCSEPFLGLLRASQRLCKNCGLCRCLDTVHEVQRISLSISKKLKIVEVAVQNATGGVYVLQSTFYRQNQQHFEISSTIRWDADPSQALSKLQSTRSANCMPVGFAFPLFGTLEALIFIRSLLIEACYAYLQRPTKDFMQSPSWYAHVLWDNKVLHATWWYRRLANRELLIRSDISGHSSWSNQQQSMALQVWRQFSRLPALHCCKQSQLHSQHNL